MLCFISWFSHSLQGMKLINTICCHNNTFFFGTMIVKWVHDCLKVKLMFMVTACVTQLNPMKSKTWLGKALSIELIYMKWLSAWTGVSFLLLRPFTWILLVTSSPKSASLVKRTSENKLPKKAVNWKTRWHKRVSWLKWLIYKRWRWGWILLIDPRKGQFLKLEHCM